MAGLIFMLVGLAIKMALMPLHGWLPDAYGDGRRRPCRCWPAWSPRSHC